MQLANWVQVAFIGACACALAFQTLFSYQMVGPKPVFWVMLYAGTFFAYHWNAVHTGLRACAWCMGTVAAAAWWLLPLEVNIACVVPGLCWLLYFGLHHPEAIGWRASAWLKPYCIALAWAWTTVYLPLSADRWLPAVPMLVERAALVFVLALAYDVYDLTADRLAGLDTLVRRVGASGAFHLMDVAWLVFVGAACAGGWAGVYPARVLMVLFVYALGARWFLRTLHRHWPAVAWHKVLIDALMPLQTVLLLLAGWCSA
ncbi:MAG: hypothetical protein ACOYNO_08415 [Saprospiraceae bacterium]